MISGLWQPLVAGCLTVILIRVISPVARNIGLVDKPDERKRHENDVPLVGGIAVAISAMSSMLLFDLSLQEFRIFFFCLAMVMIFGVLDDYHDTDPIKKIFVQALIGLILAGADSHVITNIGDVFSRGYAQGLGILTIPFSVMAIVGVINSVNMIDGLDGLAGSTALVSLIAMLYLLSPLEGVEIDGIRAFVTIMISVLIVFLVFNFSFIVGVQHQIFLGDAGSTFVGLILAFLLIDLSSLSVGALRIAVAPWILGLPLLDMFWVISIRLATNRSPFKADREHLHHVVLSFFNHKGIALLVLGTVHLLSVSVGIAGTYYEWADWVLFWGMWVVLLVVGSLVCAIRKSIDRKTAL